MSLDRLLEKLREDFKRHKYREAQKDGGELGEQIECLVSEMIGFPFGSEKRFGYQALIYNCLEEMKRGILDGRYKPKTLTVYRVLYKYAVMSP